LRQAVDLKLHDLTVLARLAVLAVERISGRGDRGQSIGNRVTNLLRLLGCDTALQVPRDKSGDLYLKLYAAPRSQLDGDLVVDPGTSISALTRVNQTY